MRMNCLGLSPSCTCKQGNKNYMEKLGCLILTFLALVVTPSALTSKAVQVQAMTEIFLPQTQRILACYYRNNVINDILLPPDVCTHIIFAFAKVTTNGIVPLKASDTASYRTIIKLKEKNPKLKVTISLQKDFPSVVSRGTESMLRFALSAVTFLQDYGFDGLDFDWELPNLLEKNTYAEFIMIVSNVLHWSNKTLSLALPHSISDFEKAYYPDTINKYVDYATIMTYDYFSCQYQNFTDFNSPLYTTPGDDPFASTSSTLDYFLFRGISPYKMLLGFPTYGRSWKLANSSNHGPHVKVAGCGDPGPVTNTTQYYLIQDVCVAQRKGGSIVQDKEAGAEYLYIGDTWVAFNGMYSARIKTDWLKEKNLAGVGVWTFENDDPHNICGMGSFPVLRKLRSYLE